MILMMPTVERANPYNVRPTVVHLNVKIQLHYLVTERRYITMNLVVVLLDHELQLRGVPLPRRSLLNAKSVPLTTLILMQFSYTLLPLRSGMSLARAPSLCIYVQRLCLAIQDTLTIRFQLLIAQSHPSLRSLDGVPV